MSALPPGFVLDRPAAPAGGELPPGFVLDRPAPAAAPAAPPPTWAETAVTVGNNAAGLVEQGARGARRGFSNFLGLPVDAASFLMNQAYNLGARAVGSESRNPIQNPVGGSDWIDQATGGFGAVPEPPAPAGPAQRYARRIGEEVGAAAVPVVGAAAGTAAGVRAGGNLVTRLFVDPFRANPNAFLRDQFVGGAAAGAGAATVNELTRAVGYDREQGSTVGQIGDIIGSFAGAGAAAGGSAIAGRASEAYRTFRDGASAVEPSAGARQAAADGIAGLFGVAPDANYGPLAQQIESGNRVGDVVPGYRETLADRTQNPAVASATFARSAGPRNPQYITRQAANEDAVNQAMQAAAPQGSPGAMIDAVIAARDARIAGANAEADRLMAEADRLAATLYPQMTPQERGQIVRGELMTALDRFTGPQAQAAEAARTALDGALQRLRPQMSGETRGQAIRGDLAAAEDAAKAQVEAAYRAAATDAVTVDPAAVTAALDAVDGRLTLAERTLVPRAQIDAVANAGRAPDAAPSASPILDEFGQPIQRPAAPPEPMSLRELTSLRTQLLNRARALRADPRAESGGADAARVVDQYTAAVEDLIQNALPPDQAAALAAARQQAFDRAERFGRRGDPVADVLAANEGGRPRVPDALVPGRFVNPEADGPLGRLLQEADTPQVRAAIQDEILSRIGRDPTPERAAEVLDQYGRALDRFPDLRQRIQAAVDAQGSVTAADTALTQRRNTFSGGSPLVAEATATRPDGIPTLPAESLSRRAVSPTGNRDLDAIFAQADTPQVRGALRDEVLARADVRNAGDPDAVESFLREYAEPLRRFPGLADEIRAAGQARGQATAARETADATARDLTTPNRSLAGTVGSFGPEQADRAIATIIQSRQPARAADELMSMIGNDAAAVNGARRAFWQWMETKSRRQGETTSTVRGTQPWMPQRLNELLDDPAVAAVAERLYRDNPEHLARIKEIAAAIRLTNLQTRARAPGSSGTAQAMQGDSVLTPEVLTSRFYAAQTGRASYPFVITAAAGTLYRRLMRVGRADMINRVVDEALLNPDFAAALLRENNPATRLLMRRAIRGRDAQRLGEAINILDDSDDDPVVRSIRE